MFCTKCGSKLVDSAKFCTGCGAPTNQFHQEKQTAQPSNHEITEQVQPEEIFRAVQQEAAPEQPAQVEEKSQPVQQEAAPEQPAQPEEIFQPEQQAAAPEQPVQPVEIFRTEQQEAAPEQPVQPVEMFHQPVQQQGTFPQQPFNQMMTGPIPQVPVTASQERKQPSSIPAKKNKKKIILIAGISAAVIVICGGLGFFLYQNNIKNQAKNVIAYFEDGEFDKSVDLYDKYSGKQKAFDHKVEEELLNRVELIKADYLSEKLDYASAEEKLHRLEEFDIDDLEDSVEEVTEFIDMIYLSRENYKAGKEYFDLGDYASAIVKYSSVVKEDKKYYDLAVKELESAQQQEEQRQEEERLNGLRDQALADAEYYAGYYDYTSAITAIEQGLSEIPGDQVLTDQLAAYKMQQELTQKVINITSTRYDNTYSDQGKDIMTVAMEFPFLEGDSPAYASINSAIEQLKNDYIEYGESMADIAKGVAADEYFYAYSLDVSYSVKYNQNGILCIMMEGYDYTGGAHGYPIRNVMTFDLATGMQLGLGDLMATDEYTFGSYVTTEFNRMFSEGLTMYWEDAPQIVQNSTESFYTMNYYITENEIVIFYYPYDLASYADGFVEVVIPYAGNEWMFKYLQ